MFILSEISSTHSAIVIDAFIWKETLKFACKFTLTIYQLVIKKIKFYEIICNGPSHTYRGLVRKRLSLFIFD